MAGIIDLSRFMKDKGTCNCYVPDDPQSRAEHEKKCGGTDTTNPTPKATEATGTTGTTGVTDELDLGPADGLQLRFAKLLLKLSRACKGQADEYLKQVEGIQAKQKEVASMIEEARAQMNACGDSKTTTTPMNMNLKEYFANNSLKTGKGESTSKPNYYTKEQWEFNLKSLTNHQEQMGTKTQSLMVILQDFVGQYNANLTGAKTAITDFTDTLKTLMR